MKRSLCTKIRLLSILPLCGLGAVALLVFLVLSQRQIASATSKDVDTASASLHSFIREERRHLEMETRMLAEVPYIKSAAMTHDPATAQDRANRYAQFLNSDGLILVDSGRVLAASGPLQGAPLETVRRLGLDAALDGAPPRSWSGIVQIGNRLVLAAAAPLMLGSTSVGCAICYQVVDERTAKNLSRLLSTRVAFLVHGRVVASEASLSQKLFTPSAQPIRATIEGEDYVGLYASLPEAGPGSGFIAFRSLREIVGPSRLVLATFLGTLFAGFCCAVLVSDRFGRQLVRPLEQLSEAAGTLQVGEWPEQFEDIRNDEIGALQRAFNDMTSSLRVHEQKLLAMIDNDPLTGLPNHRRFKELTAAVIGEEQQHPISLLLCDIDNFSDHNQRGGFSAGDEALKQLSVLLEAETPEGSCIARYGPDRFALLMPSSPLPTAVKIGERLRLLFENRIPGLTLSAGCSQTGPSTDRPESLCLAAELALSQAKQLGKNQVCDFSAIARDGSDPFELNKFLQDGTLATIQALAAAVDAKDSYTKGHSLRVAEYAAELCRYVGKSEQEVELVYRTGTLHDVGKIGVPDYVLKKTGPLTADERAMMETHPALGELIVRKVPQLQDTLPGVRSHHERWDGKGYPDGLAGEEIHWLGRILAVADTFDAMTSDRPYRKGMLESVALEEILRNAGVQFDPDLAKAFVELMTGREKLAA